MYLRQTLAAILISGVVAVSVFSASLEGLGAMIVFYVVCRVAFSVFFRTRYWRSRSARYAGARTECNNCGQVIRRQRGDWVLQCKRCGWRPSVPGLRWITHSIPAKQFARSISIGRVATVCIGILLFTAGASGAFQSGLANIQDDVQDTVPDTSINTTSDDSLNTTKVERLVWKYTNEMRRENGLSEVRYAPRIAELAERHAENMAEYDYVDHTQPNGQTGEERYDSVCDYSGSGYTFGENVNGAWYNEEFEAWGTGEKIRLESESEVARYLVDSWMRSSGHRENILNPEWSEIGVGVAVSGNKVYAAQTFC